jgi:hypothetical protein
MQLGALVCPVVVCARELCLEPAAAWRFFLRPKAHVAPNLLVGRGFFPAGTEAAAW